MGLKRNRQKEGENRIQCFRSQGEQSILRFREWLVVLNVVESIGKRSIDVIDRIQQLGVLIDDFVKSSLLNDEKIRLQWVRE